MFGAAERRARFIVRYCIGKENGETTGDRDRPNEIPKEKNACDLRTIPSALNVRIHPAMQRLVSESLSSCQFVSRVPVAVRVRRTRILYLYASAKTSAASTRLRD